MLFNVLRKKIALVTASLLLGFITNMPRSLFLTAWAYDYGSDAVGGTVRVGAGYALLGLTLAGLLCLIPLFNLRFGDSVELPELKAQTEARGNLDSRG